MDYVICPYCEKAFPAEAEIEWPRGPWPTDTITPLEIQRLYASTFKARRKAALKAVFVPNPLLQLAESDLREIDKGVIGRQFEKLGKLLRRK